MPAMPILYTMHPDTHKAVLCTDLKQWASMMFETNRTVAVTQNQYRTISTVFTGLDPTGGTYGYPLLWETLLFIGSDSSPNVTCLYSSWEDALVGHNSLMVQFDIQLQISIDTTKAYLRRFELANRP